MSDDTKNTLLKWGPLSITVASMLIAFGLLIGQLRNLEANVDIKVSALEEKIRTLESKHDHQHTEISSKLSVVENRQNDVRISVAKIEVLLEGNHKMLSEIGRSVLQK